MLEGERAFILTLSGMLSSGVIKIDDRTFLDEL